MKSKRIPTNLIALVFLSVSLGLTVVAAKDKYTLKVPNGLGFSEFKGYGDWQAVAPSQTDSQNAMRLIVANPVMIKAYRAGIPANGKPFPDGCKIAKIVWKPKQITDAPSSAATPDTVPGTLTKVELIEKDAKRFADSNGWGYAVFDYDPKSDTFTPGTLADKPPQGNDAKCGAACHKLAASTDYIFTAYPKR